jgi:hypothetical protein
VVGQLSLAPMAVLWPSFRMGCPVSLEELYQLQQLEEPSLGRDLPWAVLERRYSLTAS